MLRRLLKLTTAERPQSRLRQIRVSYDFQVDARIHPVKNFRKTAKREEMNTVAVDWQIAVKLSHR
jgi:hypothetical protein